MSRKTLLVVGAASRSSPSLPLFVHEPVRPPHARSCASSGSVLGQSWNLLGGYTGQVSFGHAAFFGVGAYTSAILVKLGLSPAAAWWGLLLGGLAAALVAAGDRLDLLPAARARTSRSRCSRSPRSCASSP